MGGLAPKLGGACFVQGPPVLGFVHFVRLRKFSRLYMDGWRDGLNRLWRDGVTILPRPAEKIATAKNNRHVPALEKKKNTAPSRPVEKKRKSHPVPPRKKTTTASSRLGKKQQPPRPASEKKNPAPSRLENKTKPPRPAMNSKIHRPEGGNWKQIPSLPGSDYVEDIYIMVLSVLVSML